MKSSNLVNLLKTHNAKKSKLNGTIYICANTVKSITINWLFIWEFVETIIVNDFGDQTRKQHTTALFTNAWHRRPASIVRSVPFGSLCDVLIHTITEQHGHQTWHLTLYQSLFLWEEARSQRSSQGEKVSNSEFSLIRSASVSLHCISEKCNASSCLLKTVHRGTPPAYLRGRCFTV